LNGSGEEHGGAVVAAVEGVAEPTVGDRSGWAWHEGIRNHQ
jgi:hypothetical protein